MNPKPAFIAKITTPNKYLLDGILFGDTSANVGIIFIHGLSSNVFAQHKTIPVIDSAMTLFFNNRGHDEMTRIKHINEETEKGYDYLAGGVAHEIFTDCVDDLQGAVNYLKELGAENIFLVGHSTGTQKATYYLSQDDTPEEIKGFALLCPVSDYAFAKYSSDELLQPAVDYAQKLVARGQPHQLLPEDIWPDELIDAQRFLSLYTKDSAEEIFTYSHPEDKPETLYKVRLPLLLILAGQDEYGDRPMSEIEQWFKAEYKGSIDSRIVDAMHNLKAQEDEVAGIISDWVKSLTVS